MNAYNIGATLLLMGAVSLPAAADEVYYDTARVLSVTPQTERINTPRQECHTEYLRDAYSGSSERGIGGAIIGGIAGGLLGSQIGKGSGRIAGAAVGAATGAIVGDRIDNSARSGYATRPVEHCSVVDNWQTVNRGYLVTYRYDGRTYDTVLPYDPGNKLRIRVAVSPEPEGHDQLSFLQPVAPRDLGRNKWRDRNGRDRYDW